MGGYWIRFDNEDFNTEFFQTEDYWQERLADLRAHNYGVSVEGNKAMVATGIDEAEKLYEVFITETLEKRVMVKAVNRHEAEDKVREAWEHEQIVLTSENFVTADFLGYPVL